MRFAFTQGGNRCYFSRLLCLASGYFLLLVQCCKSLIFFNGQLLLCCFIVFLGDGDCGVLLDFVAFLGTLLCLLCQFGQTFGIESVLSVEKLDGCLIKACEADRLKLKAVL